MVEAAVPLMLPVTLPVTVAVTLVPSLDKASVTVFAALPNAALVFTVVNVVSSVNLALSPSILPLKLKELSKAVVTVALLELISLIAVLTLPQLWLPNQLLNHQ